MNIKEIQDKNVWESFLLNCKDKTFFNSWNWAEFEKLNHAYRQAGNNIVYRLGVFNNGELIAVALVIKVSAKRGKYLLIPHGPNISDTKFQTLDFKKEIIKTLFNELKNIAKKDKVDFIRISPILERSDENEKIFVDLGFKSAPMYGVAESSWKLNIEKTEDDLLRDMRKTTRYLIKQTLNNKNLEIVKSKDIKDIDIFDKLNKEVSKRQNFIPFSYNSLKNEFLAFSKDNEVCLFFAKYEGKIIAGSLVIFYSGIGFYHQSASLGEYAKLSAPYLMQWEAIKEAKRRGCKLYDFWGYTDPKKYPKHPWAGPTLFKMGFGGAAHEYVKTKDYPISKKYFLINLFEKLRKMKRGL